MGDAGQLARTVDGTYSAPGAGTSDSGNTLTLSHLSPLSLQASDQHEQV
jgi:hypothetical protein